MNVYISKVMNVPKTTERIIPYKLNQNLLVLVYWIGQSNLWPSQESHMKN